MFVNRLVALWLPFFYISLVAASDTMMAGEEIEKYIARKLKSNDRILRLNEKFIGNEGAKILAKSSLLRNVETLIIYKGNIRDEGVRSLADSNIFPLYIMSVSTFLNRDDFARIFAPSFPINFSLSLSIRSLLLSLRAIYFSISSPAIIVSEAATRLI
jgi:hypothetical protein